MSTFTHWLTVGAAFAVAIILILLGRRTLALPNARKRPTLFLAALTFFLATYGTTLSPADEPAARPAAAASERSPAAKLPPELSSPEKWAQFKALWDELNAVEPKPDEARKKRPFADRPYGQTISAEQAQTFREKLADCFGVAVKDLPIVMARTRAELGGGKWEGGRNVKTLSPAGLALTNVVFDRIGYMERGDQTMLTRMAMPANRVWNYQALEDLEQRLDMLAALRAADKIKSEEYATAVKGVQNDIYLCAVLYVMQGVKRPIYFGPLPNPLVREQIAGLVSRMRPPAPPPLTDSEKKLADVYKRIETLKQLKANGKVEDPEYSASMNTLQKEAHDVLYFDPDAWIRGLEQMRRNPAISQQAGGGNGAVDAEMYRQTKAALEKLKAARPSIDAAAEKLEAAGQADKVGKKAGSGSITGATAT